MYSSIFSNIIDGRSSSPNAAEKEKILQIRSDLQLNFLPHYHRLKKAIEEGKADAIHTSALLIERYSSQIEAYLLQAPDLTDPIYAEIRRLSHLITPPDVVTPSTATPTPTLSNRQTFSVDEQISKYKSFLMLSEKETNAEIILKTNLFILKYHPILYHLTLEDDKYFKKAERKKVYTKFRDFEKKLACEYFEPDSPQVKIKKDTLNLIDKYFFLLSEQRQEHYVEIIKKARTNQTEYFTRNPALSNQLAMVLSDLNTLSFSKNQEPEEEQTLYDFYQIASEIHELILRTKSIDDNIPVLCSLYIYCLLSCCNSQTPLGMLTTSFGLFKLIYQVDIQQSKLLHEAVHLLFDGLKKALPNITMSYPNISSLIYCLYLFSIGQFQFRRKNEFPKTILQNAITELTNFLYVPADELNNELAPISYNTLLTTLTGLSQPVLVHFILATLRYSKSESIQNEILSYELSTLKL